MAEIFNMEAWSAWFASLDRGFVFLLVLPFVVAVVALWASYFQDDEDQR